MIVLRWHSQSHVNATAVNATRQKSAPKTPKSCRERQRIGKRKQHKKKTVTQTNCKTAFARDILAFTMTPFDDFVYLINHVLLGEEPVSSNISNKNKNNNKPTRTVALPDKFKEDFSN